MSVYTDTTPKEANFRASMAKSPESQNRRPSQSNTVFCPDPSAHQTKDTSMQHYASKAALYKVDSPQNMREADVNPLGPDGKLSSASAATSLKYARAEDLPTYPIVGIEQKHSAGAAANLAHANPKSPEWWKPEQTNSAAGKAALLANANQKSPKYWKPEHSSAAGRAATLAAGNHKVAPVWKPEATAAGSKAALLAHRDATKTDPWSPSATSAGNSAANIAFGRQKPTHIPDNSSDRSSSLSAATGATSSSARARAKSSPAPPASYPDSANSARNSLSAATLAHRASMKATKAPIMDKKPGSGALEAARIQHAKTSREMYTEHPPVSTEVGEENHQNALRASAISMAKGMYDLSEQKRHDKEAGLAATAQGRTAATAAHDKKRFSSEADIKQQAQRYLHIQEAAQKLAAERLAKIGTDEDAAYRDYYGYNNSTKSKLLRGRRGRASSNPNPQDSDSDDEFRARRIRNQMSELNRGVAEVDAKRASDRRALLAAAERKVQAQMHGLDEKIFNETGKMSAAMIEEWDARARAKAAANSEARMANHGKVNIGGGKYIDQAEIDAVAAARVQPTLDEIAERTEKQRAKEEEMRLDREEAKRLAQIEKERAADLKAEEKRAKAEEKRTAKSRTAEEKAAAKQEQEAEKAKKAEEDHIRKEEDRKAQLGAAFGTEGASHIPSPVEHQVDGAHTADRQSDDLYRPPTPVQQISAESPAATPPTSPQSPSKSNFKSFLNKLRRRSRHSSGAEETGFIGGLALRGSASGSRRGSQQHSPAPDTFAHGARSGNDHTSDVSSLSSRLSGDDRDRFVNRTITGESAATGKSSTEYEEARDVLDEGLAPPPAFATADIKAARKGSPTRESRFREMGLDDDVRK